MVSSLALGQSYASVQVKYSLKDMSKIDHYLASTQHNTMQTMYIVLEVYYSLTHCGWDKIATILQTTFSNAIFFNEKVRVLFRISLKFVPDDPINDNPSLFQIMLSRQQTIVCTNDGPVYWHIYASPSFNELSIFYATALSAYQKVVKHFNLIDNSTDFGPRTIAL